MLMIPKNWEKFQHYKHRNPPWIRLYRGILDDHEYQILPVESRAIAPMLWCIAGEHPDGVFDASVDKIAFRVRSTPEAVEKSIRPLFDAGFFVPWNGSASELEILRKRDASKMLAKGKRDATPETETETETEKIRPCSLGSTATPKKRKKTPNKFFPGGLS